MTMNLSWDFSITNALYSLVVVGGMNYVLYLLLKKEFIQDIERFLTNATAQKQLMERLSAIEESIARLTARGQILESKQERIDREGREERL